MYKRQHVLERERPAGSEGDSLQETMVPPLFEAARGVIATPTVKVNEEGVKVMDGATSLTVSVMVVEFEPAELLAHTV